MKIKYILFAAIVIASSCEVLDVDPLTQIDAENAIKDKKGLDAALNGIYDQLQSASIAQDVILFGDLAADNLIHVGTKKEYRQISDNRILPSNLYISGIWDNSYSGINMINIILEKLPDVSGISESESKDYEAQLLFLRAYNYFNLVKFFGGVPLKTEPTRGISDEELNISRKSDSEIYTFITNDLVAAKTLVEGTGKQSTIYADEGAIKALLARIYLYTEQWELAYAEAYDVIDMGYTLNSGSDYALIFDESANSNEIIFQIDFYNDDDISEMADWTLPSSRFEVAAWSDRNKTSSIFQEFSDDDLRKEITVQSTDLLGGLDYYSNKYQDFNTDSDNTIVLRLAEMYFICAEALNEIAYQADGDAFDYLNTIRERAGLNDITSSDASDQQAFRDAIEEERRLELAFEGHRYFDLVRTDRASDVLPQIGPLTQENEFLYPIPQTERDTNKEISQNNGY